MSKRSILGNLKEFYFLVLRKYVRPFKYRQEQMEYRKMFSQAIMGSALEQKKRKEQLENDLAAIMSQVNQALEGVTDIINIKQNHAKNVQQMYHAKLQELRKDIKDAKELQEMEQHLLQWRDNLLSTVGEHELNERIEQVKENLSAKTWQDKKLHKQEEEQKNEDDENDATNKPLEKLTFAQMQALQKELQQKQRDLEKQKQHLAKQIKKE